ncbi:MAG: GntR family transcriptional regulator [Nocardioides sp.]|nr:GntR family transcriptional regulator [Nocardioides sp.]
MPDSAPLPPLHLAAASSTVDRVVAELRRALFAGEIPAGTPLREHALVEATGVSRSTVREALGVLVAEGLAHREPNRGVHVTALDPEAVHDVVATRVVLESAGVRAWAGADAASRRAVRTALEEFVAAVRGAEDPGADPGLMTATHLALHRSIVALTGSPRMLGLADAVYAEIRLALSKVDRIRRDAGVQVADHEALVALLESGDTDACETALRQHLEDAAESMLLALSLTEGDAGPEHLAPSGP